MAESIRCKLEVVAAPTFSIYAPAHTLAGVVGDNIVFKVNMTAIGAFSSDVVLEVVGAPAGAVVTYSPVDATIAPGETLTVTIDTDACSAGVTDITIQEA
jgi:hypothetical protein